MKKPSKTHITLSIVLTLLSPIFLPLFGAWYQETTKISPAAIYIVYGCFGFINWAVIAFKQIEGE